MIEVEVGDTIVEFPDGTDREVMRSALQRKFGTQPEQAPAPNMLENTRDTILDSGKGLEQGVTLGFGDEIMAGAMTPFEMIAQRLRGDDVSLSDAYDSNLKREREAIQTAQERSPVANMVGNIAGGVATGGAANKVGLTLLKGAKPTVASMGGRGAAEGVGYGAVQGFGSGEGANNRLEQAGVGAVIGGVTGGAIGAGGAVHANRAASKLVSSIEDLKVQKDAAYAAVDASGHKYTPVEFDKLLDRMGQRMTRERINPMRHPKAASMLSDIRALKGQSPTLTELDQLRQVVRRDVANATDQSEARLGKFMIDEIDGFIDRRSGGELIKNARSLNRRLSNAERLDLARTKAERRAGATGSGGNVENATRQKVLAILDSPKQSAFYSKAELAAMNEFVQGGKLQNFLRLVGKLSPSGNGLMAALGIGGTVVNPTMAVIPAAGMASKMGSEALARNSMNTLGTLVRNGGVKPVPQIGNSGKTMRDLLIREGSRQTSTLGYR